LVGVDEPADHALAPGGVVAMTNPLARGGTAKLKLRTALLEGLADLRRGNRDLYSISVGHAVDGMLGRREPVTVRSS
jgi:hypothetical protein